MTTYSPVEVAAIVNPTEKTVRRWLKKGMIPGAKMGRVWIVEEDALRKCLDPSGAIPGNAQNIHRYHLWPSEDAVCTSKVATQTGAGSEARC
jgi:excisionase family DNA binding protein